MEHQEILGLVISYALVGAFLFTLLVTCLSLVGWIKFADLKQQRRLFGVLVLELVAGCLAFFFNFLNLNPSKTLRQIETRTVLSHRQVVDEFTTLLDPLVDAYIDQKLQNFENFFFKEYGPVYFSHWIESFKTLKGRNYDPSVDFPLLYNDLVAEYQAETKPIEQERRQIRSTIASNIEGIMSSKDEKFIVTMKEQLFRDVDKAISYSQENVKSRINAMQGIE